MHVILNDVTLSVQTSYISVPYNLLFGNSAFVHNGKSHNTHFPPLRVTCFANSIRRTLSEDGVKMCLA